MAKEQKILQHWTFKLQSLSAAAKKSGTATDDEINDKLVIPFTLDADGIEDLLQRIQDAEFLITDKDGKPKCACVEQ